jgi:hypothetical protein
MLGRAPLYLVVALSLALAAPAAAQRADSARLVHLSAPLLAGVSVHPAPPGGSPGLPYESGAKSPVVAGFLSFLMPGVGSFYAGNSTHGFVHLGVVMGSALVTMATCGQGKDAPCGGVSTLATLVILVNWPWSVVTAVRDARAAGNRASRQVSR